MTCGSLVVSGWIIRARQLTAPPQLRTQTFQVGRYHQADVQMPVKGCRCVVYAWHQLHKLWQVMVEAVITAGLHSVVQDKAMTTPMLATQAPYEVLYRPAC